MLRITTFSLIAVAFLAFGFMVGSFGNPLSPNRDVLLEIPSMDGQATLQTTIGLRVVGSNGATLFIADPSQDDVLGMHETLLNEGLVVGGYAFSDRTFRSAMWRKWKELLKKLL